MSFQEGFRQRWIGYKESLEATEFDEPLEGSKRDLEAGEPVDLSFLDTLHITHPDLARNIIIDVKLQELATHYLNFTSIDSTVQFVLANRRTGSHDRLKDALREALNKTEGSSEVARGIRLAQIDGFRLPLDMADQVKEILRNSHPDLLFEVAQAGRKFVVLLKEMGIEGADGNRFFAPNSIDSFKLAVWSLDKVPNQSFGDFLGRKDKAMIHLSELLADYLRNPNASDFYKDVIAVGARFFDLKNLVVPAIEYLIVKQPEGYLEAVAELRMQQKSNEISAAVKQIENRFGRVFSLKHRSDKIEISPEFDTEKSRQAVEAVFLPLVESLRSFTGEPEEQFMPLLEAVRKFDYSLIRLSSAYPGSIEDPKSLAEDVRTAVYELSGSLGGSTRPVPERIFETTLSPKDSAAGPSAAISARK